MKFNYADLCPRRPIVALKLRVIKENLYDACQAWWNYETRTPWYRIKSLHTFAEVQTYLPVLYTYGDESEISHEFICLTYRNELEERKRPLKLLTIIKMSK